MIRRAFIAGLALLASLPAVAAPAAAPALWKVDSAHSAITFTGAHTTLGAFTGAFRGWTAQIAFDPADLAHSRVAVTIPTAGVKTGKDLIDAAWKDKEWFDVAAHPTASFTASSFKALGANKFSAAGILTIKGKPYSATLPFTLAIAGKTATMNATLTLDRTQLDIGMSSDPGADWVAKAVKVKINLRATRA
jgi:polyisoprenoid-binding protein YceI